MRRPATGRLAASSDVASANPVGTVRLSWSPWRTVVGFGVVSLAADMVYEGARSVTGPLLASLGASAVLVGLISGAGEAMALLLRLVSGSWADRSGRYWTLTFAGYALTAICVPALAITPFLAGAGLAVACVLILGERLGKAVRSPAKTALLAHAAAAVGLGRGFGVHKALDQLGAVAGPLLVAGGHRRSRSDLASHGGADRPGSRRHAPAVSDLAEHGQSCRERRGQGTKGDVHSGTSRVSALKVAWSTPRRVLVVRGRLRGNQRRARHLRNHRLPPHARSCRIPRSRSADLRRSDGRGGASRAGIRLALRPHQGRRPARSAAPRIRRTGSGVRPLPLVAMAGALLWGAAGGVLDSTIKALVADLVPASRLATAYGLFAAAQGAAAIAGGVMAGALYERSLPILVAAVAVTRSSPWSC